MTLARRIIPCLDVDRGRVVKGVGFRNLTSVGDPARLAANYEAEGADEITLLDVSASSDDRDLQLEAVAATASVLSIPLTVGGGIRSVTDIDLAVRAGADKVAVNTAAVERPQLITDAAHRYGAQCVVVSIDAARVGTRWCVCVRGGRQNTGLDALEWARECTDRGAGEILLTSIDRDGTRSGYDLALTAAVAASVSIPVIASGGAGCTDHVRDAFHTGRADAALIAGILHSGDISLGTMKRQLAAQGIPVRLDS